ncbi:hypothetical protein ACIRL2_38905 [Embleya sp. NPDC127516]|uniref:hypothetical protein n=1 Tax=Embleya sp. NPDC127516 TaxID=3363990 RepID=UPI0038038E57
MNAVIENARRTLDAARAHRRERRLGDVVLPEGTGEVCDNRCRARAHLDRTGASVSAYSR